MLERLATTALAWINKTVPKKRTALILGWPDYAPNAVAISNALVRYTDLDITMLLTGLESRPPATMEASERLTLRRHRSLSGIWAYLRSRHVFITHGILGNRFLSKHQVVVHLWHGMPVKRIAALDGHRPPEGLDYVVAAGTFWIPILSEAFAVDPQNVLATGIPRTDLLLAGDSRSRAPLDLLPGLSSTDRLVAWLPTYRRSIVGDIRTDGAERGNELQIDEKHFESLNEAFARVGAKCVVKAHPMAPRYTTGGFENLVFITDDDLSHASIDLYTFLSHCDGLISDISGVWIDYLATGKPILFFFPDIDEYTGSRGLTIDDYEDFVPGVFVKSPEDLPDAIESVFASPVRMRRADAKIRALNVAEDADSALRVLQELGIVDEQDAGGANPASNRP